MISTRAKSVAVVAVAAIACAFNCRAGDLKISIPLQSKTSPVQRLNREGVLAVKKGQYQKAEELFYKAYLYDPSDPFTLNNLGFVSEQQGRLDRAHRFYELSAQQSCTAEIALSSSKDLEKKPMRAAVEGMEDTPMRVNRMNVDAMRLLSQDRAYESVALLEKAQALDPRNPFTLNNLGVAHEAVGDYQGALDNYHASAALHSSEPVMVTLDHAWAGKQISDMAEASAGRLQKHLQEINGTRAQAAMLNMRGVRAANQNDWSTAKQDFLRAYQLDPADAFSLNNRGYIAEKEGDLESAQYFYQKARRADDANAKVGSATALPAEGEALLTVAAESDRKVDGAIGAYSRERHRETGPVELTPRGAGAENTPNTSAPVQPHAQPLPNAVPPSTQQLPHQP
jgi:Flp pilus assembly protein TadD